MTAVVRFYGRMGKMAAMPPFFPFSIIILKVVILSETK
jgi:hypothetical protein